ncbi:1,2-phenylacetyl-CoA epoxidase subunit PaaD [Rufibacter tibetensis]|uniref:1,2-phenylacetyl-CoA epoxidase subunit PaaD n=1 Tax=Rufibacter tibetensis TaxID=512763 RepID=UPI0009FAA50A|nr:1,2-phenylacetyl-CoA epoxidase subunit PaaD [Rufibacter tibetensis]
MTTEEKIWHLLEEVSDPEIPVLSILDLGVLRKVQVQEGGRVQVTITPTYSGCPAMNTIAADVKLKLLSEGFKDVAVDLQLSPAWTTDWLSEEGKLKLEEYGIAPPVEPNGDIHALFGRDTVVRCPLCKSENTKLISQFGSTSCKSLYQCHDCLEPFDYFKCLK